MYSALIYWHMLANSSFSNKLWLALDDRVICMFWSYFKVRGVATISVKHHVSNNKCFTCHVTRKLINATIFRNGNLWIQRIVSKNMPCFTNWIVTNANQSIINYDNWPCIIPWRRFMMDRKYNEYQIKSNSDEFQIVFEFWNICEIRRF